MYQKFKGCLFLVVIALIGYMYFTFGGKSNGDVLPTVAVLPSLTWTAEAVAIISTVVNRSGFVTITPGAETMYPTATITDTPSPTVTYTDAPTHTALPTETPALQVSPAASTLYDVISTANARSCPDSKCELIGKFQSGNILSVTGIVSGEVYKNNPLWIQTIYHDGQTVYVHSSLVTAHVEYVQPVSPVIQVTAAPQSRFVCPSNCTDAVAMGLSAEQAATCPELDRNHNGVACYGD